MSLLATLLKEQVYCFICLSLPYIQKIFVAFLVFQRQRIEAISVRIKTLVSSPITFACYPQRMNLFLYLILIPPVISLLQDFLWPTTTQPPAPLPTAGFNRDPQCHTPSSSLAHSSIAYLVKPPAFSSALYCNILCVH